MEDKKSETKISNGKGWLSNKALVLTLSIALPFVLILGLLIASARSIGSDNPLSKIAKDVPVERIPLLNLFAPGGDELVADALLNEANSDLIKDMGGREVRYTTNIKGGGMINGEDIELNITSVGNIATNSDSGSVKLQLDVSGSLNAGPYDFDIGSNSINGDIIMEDRSNLYASFNLSDAILNQVLDVAEEAGFEVNRDQLPQLKEVMGKYALINIEKLMTEYFKLASEYQDELGTTTTDVQESFAFYELMMDEDFNREFNEIIQKFWEENRDDIKEQIIMPIMSENYWNYDISGREEVNGRTAIVVTMDLDEGELDELVYDLYVGFMNYMVDNEEQILDLLAECIDFLEKEGIFDKLGGEGMDFDKKELLDSYRESLFDEIRKELEDEDKLEEAKDGIKESFVAVPTLFDLRDIKVYIDVEDNTILKSEAILEIKKSVINSAIRAYDEETSFYGLEIKFVMEEVGRGDQVKIEAPKEYKDFTDDIIKMLRESLENASKQMEEFRKNYIPTPISDDDLPNYEDGAPCNIDASTIGIVEDFACLPVEGQRVDGAKCLIFAGEEDSMGKYSLSGNTCSLLLNITVIPTPTSN